MSLQIEEVASRKIVRRKPMIKRVHLRAILSSAIVMLGIPVGFSSIGLYFAPSCGVARQTGWTFLGFTKDHLTALHNTPGLILVFLLLLHFALNLKVYMHEIKTASKYI